MRGAGTEVGEHRARLIAVLFAQFGVVDAAAVDARRRAGLQPADPQRQLPQSRRQSIRGRIAGAAARMALHADVDPAAEKGADGEYDVAGEKFDAALRDAALDSIAPHLQIGNLLLEQLQVRLPLEKAANGAPVQLAVRLRPSGAHRGPLAGVERSKLYARLVGGERHGTARAHRSP